LSPARAVDPRVERSRQAILRAALEELGEAGYGAFAIESVAARAGVGKSTIYRHWRDRVSLIEDAFHTMHEQAAPDLASGSALERLERVLRHVAEVAANPPFSTCIPALIDAAERDPRLRAFHHAFQAEARRPTVALIQEAIDGRELPRHVDAELAAASLLGAIFFRRLMTPEPFDPGRAGDLLKTVFGV
jgi:AcrR family transcriptional regulator